MEFDLEKYVNLEKKELEASIKKAEENLISLKKILMERDNQSYKAFENYDLDLLKKSLEHNEAKVLDSQIWAILTFRYINENHIDFIKYVMNLPEYKVNNNSNYGPISRTSEAVLKGFTNKKLFDFFIANEQFKKSFDFLLNDEDNNQGINPNVPNEIIKELFDRKMLHPSKELVQCFINKNCFNFLDYLYENKIYAFDKEDYHQIYSSCWKNSNETIYKWVTEEYPEYKNIKLDNLVNKGLTSKQTDFCRNYKIFLDLSDEVFLNTIRVHPSSQVEVTYIIHTLNSSNEYNKFHKFVELLVSEKPEMIPYLKSAKKHIKSSLLMTEFGKAMEYIEMKENLSSSNEKTKKKLKL